MNAPLHLPHLGFSKTTLANGLDVIALRAGTLPIVAVNLWYHVGSKNEERTQRGFAHLFEHLMFEGSEHYPGDYFKPLQKLGASVNGSTSSDRTNYFVDLPTAHVELAVAMESDRMGHFLPALSDEKVRVQKDVVKNEYRQNYANRPYGQVSKILAEALYPPEHPYSWPTIGSMEDVERASRDDIESFFRRFYVPSNASLALVGNIDPDDAFALADRYFGTIPGGIKASPLWISNETSLGRKDLTIRERVELDRLYLCWPSVRHFEPDDAPLTLLADILSRGRTSRLYRKLVVDEQIAQDISSYQSGRELGGSFGVVVTMRHGCEIARASEAITGELESIRDRGVTAEELARVKNGRLAGFLYALDNVGGFGGIADRLNAYNTYLGDPGRITSDLERYVNVTSEQISSAITSHLLTAGTAGEEANRVSLKVLGRKPVTTLPPLDRSIRPTPAKAAAFRAPAPVVRTLANGIPLWVIPRRDLPIISATAVVRAGASSHASTEGGLASLTANMMDEGTRTRSAADLALETESLGTNLSSSCGWDGSYVSMQCLSPHLVPSLDLMVDVLLEPTFPQSEFARVSAQTLDSLRSERDSAEARGHRALLRALYPGEHTYRTPADGDEETVARFNREDLLRFHEENYSADRAAFVVAGDVDPDAIASLLDLRLTGWKSTSPPPRMVPQVDLPEKVRLLLVDRPGSPQAVVRIGHPGPPRMHPDHDHLSIFNQILGGQFTSRLNAKLREEKGFTYGVRSSFDSRRGPGPFTIAASLQADRLDEALEDIRAEVEGLLGDRPPTRTELDDARRALIEGQARHFETPSALVSRYAGLFLYGLPLDEHAKLAERLDAITTDSMIAAARRHIFPSSLTYVVVADAQTMREKLERLDWCEVELLSPRSNTSEHDGPGGFPRVG